MKHNRPAVQVLIAILFCLATAIASARSGLVLEAATGGLFWSPSLRSVRVAGVEPGSDAQRAGFREGDEILKIDDKAIVGGKAKVIKAYWDALPKGKPVVFVIRREQRELLLTMVMGG